MVDTPIKLYLFLSGINNFWFPSGILGFSSPFLERLAIYSFVWPFVVKLDGVYSTRPLSWLLVNF